MWSVPLRVSCPGPVLRLACLGGGGPVPVPPYLAWGCGGGGPGAGLPDSHDVPDAHGASPCGMRGGVGVTVAGVVLQCPGSWPSWAALPILVQGEGVAGAFVL